MGNGLKADAGPLFVIPMILIRTPTFRRHSLLIDHDAHIPRLLLTGITPIALLDLFHDSYYVYNLMELRNGGNNPFIENGYSD